MNCPQCGEDCRCQPDISPAAPPRWIADAECDAASLPQLAPLLAEVTETASHMESAEEIGEKTAAEGSSSAEENSSAWRDELATRLNRYRARRKPRPPRYPSLRLRFDPPPISNPDGDDESRPGRIYETSSNQALALDSLTEVPADPDYETGYEIGNAEAEASPAEASAGSYPPAYPGAKVSGKLIEFPRHASIAPPVPLDELAEPVLVRPRILEAPDLTPPPPALGGITIEGAEQKEVEKRLGIDIPLQSAPLGRRVAAAIIDGAIITGAAALFGMIFWKVSGAEPPRIQMLALSAGVPCLFWAFYQYLLIVYSAATPGLRMAGLELTRFDGAPTSRRVRRWRVLASYLSALSLGMGYVWLFLDEDALCWHDRITHTYLARKNFTGKKD